MVTLSTKAFIDFKSYFFFQLVQNFNQLFQKFVQNQHDLHIHTFIILYIYFLPLKIPLKNSYNIQE